MWCRQKIVAPALKQMAWGEIARGEFLELTIIAISHQSPLVEIADRVYRVGDGAAALVDGAAQRSGGSAGRTHSTVLPKSATPT